MKRLSFFVLLTVAVTVFSTSSCNKDELTPTVNSNSVNTAPAPYTIDLIAYHWSQIASGVYTCPFSNIIPPGYRNNREVKVYLLTADQKIQINDPIHFMGGQLSATRSAIDVILNYRHYGELPFHYLNIKVVIE
jgi:hypothetical protein